MSTDRVRETAGDDDVPGSVELLTLGVHHQHVQAQPGPGDPGDDLAVVLQGDVLPLHLHYPVPHLELWTSLMVLSQKWGGEDKDLDFEFQDKNLGDIF